MRGEIGSFKEQQEQAQNAATLNEIAQFSKGKEYFEEVKPAMVKLLQSGMATTLQEAYDKALKLDDELSEQIQKATQARTEAERRRRANRAAKAATGSSGEC